MCVNTFLNTLYSMYIISRGENPSTSGSLLDKILRTVFENQVGDGMPPPSSSLMRLVMFIVSTREGSKAVKFKNVVFSYKRGGNLQIFPGEGSGRQWVGQTGGRGWSDVWGWLSMKCWRVGHMLRATCYFASTEGLHLDGPEHAQGGDDEDRVLVGESSAETRAEPRGANTCIQCAHTCSMIRPLTFNVYAHTNDPRCVFSPQE